jgi:hypothetical protein
MHHRSSGSPIDSLRAALARSAAHISRRRGALMALSLAVAVLSGTALAGQRTADAPSSAVVTADAAAARALPATNATDGADPSTGVGDAWSTPAADAVGEQPTAGSNPGHRQGGDHQREAPEQAPALNPNCTLVVPREPLSAAGLATPYQLTATDPAAGPCHEAEADQSAFVEAAVFDPATHGLSIYHPLVVDRGDRPAVAPVPVSLPAGATVGIWFGFNGDTLTLGGPGATACVNGLPGSPFGQFAYCNAAPLFSAATADPTFQASIPALGISPVDSLPCPTSRDFSVVDQDQSDNLATAYRVINGRMAQVTPTTAARGTKLTNGSDEGLVANFIAPALGCRPFTAPDLTNGGAQTPALALNELLAAAHQSAPALVPTSDPMVLVDGARSERKTNLYRAGVGQPALPEGQTPRAYCAAIVQQAPARLALDAKALRAAPSPAAASPDLLTFLQDRLANTLVELDCKGGSAAADAVDTGTAAPTTAPTTTQPTTGAGATAPASPSTGPAQDTARPSAGTTVPSPSGTAGRATPSTDQPRHHRPGPTTTPAPTAPTAPTADPTAGQGTPGGTNG